MDPATYLERIDLTESAVDEPNVESLYQLQRAHLRTVPFETLSITGTPVSDTEPDGVTLDEQHLLEKIVDRHRGGFCFELNGAFGWLLDALEFDADRVAGRVAESPPANHHAHVVHLDQPYVVDVGLGGTRVRRPIPIDGTVVEDAVGVNWRVRPSDRPDVDYRVESQEPDESEFSRRYVFESTPRELQYFEATCDYLQSAPESPFTGDPIVSIATQTGRVKLTDDTLVRFENGQRREESVPKDDWNEILVREFGLTTP